jgi:HKD family nuclease
LFVVQNDTAPAAMQNALFDLMRGGVDSLRVCCAYMSISGAQTLYDGLVRATAGGRADEIAKTIVTSFDYGLTDPESLRFWLEKNSRVLVAGAEMVENHRLNPRTAFHPKFYLFGRPNGSIGSLVGSANLTNRGLTVNTEVAWLELEIERPRKAEDAWTRATEGTSALTNELLTRYAALRRRAGGPVQGREELEPVPAPQIGRPGLYRPFADAGINPRDYTQMWIQSRGMQGGAGTQLELPRGSHRFFGARNAPYAYERVAHIAEPVLVSGRQRWRDRPLTWHGDNAMERINLPSATMGGFRYENSLILFRRIAPNTFELRVHPWASDATRAYMEASRRAGLVFRVGRNSNRIAGFLS